MGSWAPPVPNVACVAVGAGSTVNVRVHRLPRQAGKVQPSSLLQLGTGVAAVAVLQGNCFAVTGEQRAVHCPAAMVSTNNKMLKALWEQGCEWGLLC